MRIEPAPTLGGDGELGGWPFRSKPGDQPFAATVTVHVGGIEEGDAFVESCIEGSHGVVLGHVTPIGPDRPCPKPDTGDVKTCATQASVLHVSLLRICVAG